MPKHVEWNVERVDPVEFKRALDAEKQKKDLQLALARKRSAVSNVAERILKGEVVAIMCESRKEENARRTSLARALSDRSSRTKTVKATPDPDNPKRWFYSLANNSRRKPR